MSYNKSFRHLNLKYAYFLASEISDLIVSDDSEEKLDKFLWFYAKSLEEYFMELLTDNIEKLVTPSKDTVLHRFISDISNMAINFDVYWFKDEFYNEDPEEIENYIYERFVQILEYYGVSIPGYPECIREICKNYNEENPAEYEIRIKGAVDGIVTYFERIEDSIVNEVFYLLFNDKLLLLRFNLLLSEYVRKIDCKRYPSIFDKSNNIVRCQYLPEWIKKAIYFRDNGTCQHCHNDLSGFIRINEDRELQFDHIIPIEKGGSNDPTNFQLLCRDCNLKKHGEIIIPKYYFAIKVA